MAIFESTTWIEFAILFLLIIIVIILSYFIFHLIISRREYESFRREYELFSGEFKLFREESESFRRKFESWSFGRYGLRPFWRENESDYQFKLHEIIKHAELKAGILLSWGAHEMLAIPILESIESEGGVDWSEVEESVNSLVSTIAAEDLSRRKTPNSIALIWSFWKNFCNIPPFCSRKER